MSLFITPSEDGSYYSLTSGGLIAIAVLIVLLVAVIGFIHAKKKASAIIPAAEKEPAGKTAKSRVFNTRQITFSAMGIALAFVLSYIRIFRFPWGGSITLCSMFFVVIIGYWYGLRAGLIAGFVYGCLQFIQGGGTYILDPLQAGLDYFLAFTALGLSGAFRGLKKHALEIGYAVAVLARGALHAIGGYIYWMDYMPEEFPASLAAVYPIVYNYCYIIGEAILTIIIISLPPVRKALQRITDLALS